jgi:hypothetical protein
LAIVSKIRELVSHDELRVKDILEQTQIVGACETLLFPTDNGDVELYCVKLEVYWILTNLLTTNDKDCIAQILGVSHA